MNDVTRLYKTCVGYKSCMACHGYDDLINRQGGGSKFSDPDFYEFRDENSRRAMRSVFYLSKNIEDKDLRKEYESVLRECARCGCKKTWIADLLKGEIEKPTGDKGPSEAE